MKEPIGQEFGKFAPDTAYVPWLLFKQILTGFVVLTIIEIVKGFKMLDN